MDESLSTGAMSGTAAAAGIVPTPRAAKVLLAECNRLNQRIADRMLKTDGHQVTTVANGEQLVAALAQSTFDLILMCEELPEMTGAELAGIVRENEAVTGGHIPIVAMTSSATQGDYCLRAGMDRSLGAPLDLEQLRHVIASLLPLAAAEPAFDRAAALLRMNGDQSFLCVLATMFIDESPAMIAALRTAVEEQDGGRLVQAAHKLKGAACPFYAAAVIAMAQSLESIGESGQMEAASAALRRFEAENDRLLAALAALLACAAVQQNPLSNVVAGPEGTIPCTT